VIGETGFKHLPLGLVLNARQRSKYPTVSVLGIAPTPGGRIDFCAQSPIGTKPLQKACVATDAYVASADTQKVPSHTRTEIQTSFWGAMEFKI
jgi:hypothetical protein